MKVTVDWLKQYVDISLPAKEIAQRLTMLGLEVDNVEEIDYEFDKVVVGKIIDVQQHPQKRTLNICKVDVGHELLTLVCGAPNVTPGIKVPVALVGAKLPGEITVKAANIHGYDSPGMICSELELGLSRQSEIVMVLDEKAEVGQDLRTVLGRGEVVIEIDLTPNRPDCLGVIGIAREIAAITRSQLKKPSIILTEAPEIKTAYFVEVEILNPESCPRYIARYVENVKIAPSPRWLVKKLEAVGLRSINNVVDVTNYVMMETGQPLHAFDFDLLEGHKIIVRHAKKNEQFTTLDGQIHQLPENALLICDAKKPVALAGIMGGLNSEISSSTKRVLLESAYFNPNNIRRTAKLLGIFTDSSQRFERGVDPEGQKYAIDRAAELLAQLADAKIATGCVDCYPNPVCQRAIRLRVDRVNHVLGTSISKEEIIDILQRLEFKIGLADATIHVDVPSFRVDIEREIDLIEEIARIYGYDQIEPSSYSLICLNQAENKREKFNQMLRDFLFGMGFHEVLTHSLIHQRWAEKFCEYSAIQLKNPINEELGVLRTSLIPGLIQVTKWNMNRYQNDLMLFEIGNVFYWSDKDKLRSEELQKISLLRTGKTSCKNWLQQQRASTFYDLKGDVFALLEKLKISDFEFQQSNQKFLDKRSIDLILNGRNFGYIGALASDLLQLADIDDDVFVAELDGQFLFENCVFNKTYQPLPKFPAVKRDISVVVDENISAHEVEKIVWQSGGKFLRSVQLFDLYKGKQIADNKKSLTFSLTFYSLERTLTEKEADADLRHIIENLNLKLNAQLRAQ